jgi:hypothetical protein
MKKKMITIMTVLMVLPILSCEKEDSANKVISELKSYECGNHYESKEPYILSPEMVVDNGVKLTFAHDFYADIFNLLDHRQFGTANGVDTYGKLTNFSLKQLWIKDFKFQDQEVFKEGEVFSNIFERAMLSYDFDNESRILAIQNSLTEEGIFDQIDFNVQSFDLADVVNRGVLTLHLFFKEHPTEIRYFDYNFEVGAIVDGIYILE